MTSLGFRVSPMLLKQAGSVESRSNLTPVPEMREYFLGFLPFKNVPESSTHHPKDDPFPYDHAIFLLLLSEVKATKRNLPPNDDSCILQIMYERQMVGGVAMCRQSSTCPVIGSSGVLKTLRLVQYDKGSALAPTYFYGSLSHPSQSARSWLGRDLNRSPECLNGNYSSANSHRRELTRCGRLWVADPPLLIPARTKISNAQFGKWVHSFVTKISPHIVWVLTKVLVLCRQR